ncbi:PDH-domain-containing protein, partial [Rhizophagus irregularis]
MIALTDQEFLQQCLEKNEAGKRQFVEFCEKHQLHYYPSETNFILFEVKADSDVVFKEMMKRGFIIRSGNALSSPGSFKRTRSICMTRNVFVIGLGLIGGSIALSCQKAPETKVFGYDVQEKTRELAAALNIVHEVVEDVEQAASMADVIIFGTPVNATLYWMDELKNWKLKPNVIITDTGSTKSLIMKKAVELREKGITFIGGHPMAGSHKSGVSAAKQYLFENAYYILTPFDDEDGNQIIKLEQLLKFTLAKIVKVDAREHDHMTAVVSHFPHIVAASLVHQLNFEKEKYPMTSLLAAGGFRDIT